METKRNTSFRLSEEALDMLAQLARHFGITKTAVIEMLLREQWRTNITQPSRKKGSNHA
jgi:predicted DNA-binding protein